MADKHTPYYNFLDALKEQSCPVCFLVKKGTHKTMDDFLYESVNDPGLRQEIRHHKDFVIVMLGSCRNLGMVLDKQLSIAI